MTDTYSEDEGPQFDPDTDGLLAKFESWDRQLDTRWSQWRSNTREAYDFVAGRQWSTDEKAMFEEDNRIMATVNRIETTVDAVSGAEIMGRQEVTYLPRTVEDAGPTDVLSQGAQYVRQNCDAEDEETDAFRDCLICGVGWTETRISYDVELDGEIVIDRIDPMEMSVDPSSRKANFADARYLRREIKMSREEAKATFPEIEDFDHPTGADAREPTVVDPQVRYKNGEAAESDDEVIVREYQWFDEVPVHRANIGGQIQEIPAEMVEMAEAEGVKVIRQKKRVYRKAFCAAGQVFDEQDILEFSFKAITGKRDRNKGTFYGIVAPMMDPQRFANTAMSAIINHYRETSKGGIVMESGAVEDQRDFENSYADSGKITWVQPGALSSASGPKFIQKPVSQIPPALPAILETAITGIQDSTGVNKEILGMADRQQPGVLEHQRKQAAYGILSAFFNSIRRYRKMQGRLLLKLMPEGLPEGELVRIVGGDGQARYVPIAYHPDTMKYDVIVDESPTSPNQKERVFAILSQFQGLLGEASPEIIAELVRYSPLPANVSEKLAGLLNPPPDPAAQQAAQVQQQMAMAAGQQEIRKTASEATKNEAQAQAEIADSQRSDAEAARALTETMLNQAAEQALVNTGATE